MEAMGPRRGRPAWIVAAALLAWACLAVVVPPDARADFETVPGSSELVGEGRAYKFKVQVEEELGFDRQEFGDMVERTLLDDRSWTASGRVAFKRVGGGGDTRVMLASPGTTDELCRPLPTDGTYSCQVGERLVINVRRWRHAVSHWHDSLESYRRMVLNHEMGHRIGHSHRGCPDRGRKAPVMQQQSMSLQGCDPNAWPLGKELRATR